MHDIHCGSAVFPYQPLERRPVQETLIGCAVLHNIQHSKALNIHPVSVCVCTSLFIVHKTAPERIFVH
jgi:hypothetical protein